MLTEESEMDDSNSLARETLCIPEEERGASDGERLAVAGAPPSLPPPTGPPAGTPGKPAASQNRLGAERDGSVDDDNERMAVAGAPPDIPPPARPPPTAQKRVPPPTVAKQAKGPALVPKPKPRPRDRAIQAAPPRPMSVFELPPEPDGNPTAAEEGLPPPPDNEDLPPPPLSE